MSPFTSLKIQTLRQCTVAYFVLSWRDCYPRRSCPSVWSLSPHQVSSRHRNDLAGIALSPSALRPLPRFDRTAVIHCTFDTKLDSPCKIKILFHTLTPSPHPMKRYSCTVAAASAPSFDVIYFVGFEYYPTAALPET